MAVNIENVPVLFIDDDLVDGMSFQRGMKHAGLGGNVNIMTSASEALDALRQRTIPFPCLIILDLNMPVMSGFDFLEALRTDKTLKFLPVWVLSTSSSPEDVTRAYDLNATGYMVKTRVGHNFSAAIGLIRNYLEVVECLGLDGY